MTKTVVDELLISIGFDTAQIAKSTKDVESIITQSLSRIKTAVATVFGADFMKDMLVDFAKAGSELEFMSQKFNTSVTNLNAWQEGVKRFGGSAEGFTSTLTSLQSAIQDVAVTGGGSVGGLLAAIGVKARDANGKIRPTVEVLKDLGQVFKGMDRNRAQYLQRQLGIDDGTFRMLLMGKQQLNQYLDVMAKQSVMDDKRAEKALVLKRKLDDLNQAWTNIKITIGTAVIPVFNVIEKLFTTISNQYIPKMLKGIEQFQDKLGLSSEQMKKLTKYITMFIGVIGGLVGANLIIKTIAGSLMLVGGGFRLIMSSVLGVMSPIGRLIAALTIIYGFYQKMSNSSDQAISDATSALISGHPVDAYNMLGHDQKRQGDGGIAGSGIFLNQNIGQAWDELKSGNIIGAFKTMMKPTGEPVNMTPEIKHIWEGMNPHEKAQLMQESGGKNVVGDNGRSFGLFQIQPETASRDAWGGQKVTGEQLMNPQFNLETYRRLQAKYLKEAGGNQLAADARYNGGLGGQAHFLKTGKSYNDYAEKIAYNTPMYQTRSVPKTTNTNNHTVNVNGNISLPSVRNSQDFVDQMQQYSNPLNITRGVNNFQTGRLN